MKYLLYLGSVIVVALVLGTGSAWWVVAGSGSEAVRYGAWKFYPLVGSSAASDLLRAKIARGGLLALNRSEAIYFIAEIISHFDLVALQEVRQDLDAPDLPTVFRSAEFLSFGIGVP